MELLFVLDRGDYTEKMPVNERHCVRAIIRRDGKLMVQRSLDGEYKLPGGGVEPGEDFLETLTREVLEETGLTVSDNGVTPIGEVIEKRLDIYDKSSIYLNHTAFYECKVEGKQCELHLTPEEEQRGYTAVWAFPSEIIEQNDRIQKDYWRRRDTLFLKWYMEKNSIAMKAEP